MLSASDITVTVTHRKQPGKRRNMTPCEIAEHGQHRAAERDVNEHANNKQHDGYSPESEGSAVTGSEP